MPQSAALPLAKTKPAAPAYVEPPPPAAGEQEKILDRIREYALSYSKSLPDFICLQVTRRLQDQHYRPGSPGSYTQADRLVEKVSYFDRKEKYEPLSQNSAGCSKMFSIPKPTTFTWDHWGTLRGRYSYAFRYFVARQPSKYTVDYERKQQTTPGYHGLIYIEKSSNAIIRLHDIHQRVDYDHVDISGHRLSAAHRIAGTEPGGVGARHGNINHSGADAHVRAGPPVRHGTRAG